MRSIKRLSELDSLRGIAALSVLGYHFTTRYREIIGKEILNGFEFKYGYLGVEMFFMISGFVIFMTAEKVKGPGEFLSKRIIRLFPAYWICLFISFIVLTIWPIPQRPVDFSTFLVNITMFQELFKVGNIDGSYWSLWVEWMFYILVAALLSIKLLKMIYLWLGTWLLLSLVNTFFRLPLSYSFLNLYFAPYFIAGISFYRLWKKDGIPYLNWFFIAACGVVIAFQDVPLANKVSYWLFVLIFAGFVFNRLQWLNQPALIWLGNISYVLYLIHLTIGFELLIALEKLSGPLSLFVTIVIILFLSHFINLFIEKPVADWLRGKLVKKKSKNQGVKHDTDIAQLANKTL